VKEKMAGGGGGKKSRVEKSDPPEKGQSLIPTKKESTKGFPTESQAGKKQNPRGNYYGQGSRIREGGGGRGWW